MIWILNTILRVLNKPGAFPIYHKPGQATHGSTGKEIQILNRKIMDKNKVPTISSLKRNFKKGGNIRTYGK